MELYLTHKVSTKPYLGLGSTKVPKISFFDFSDNSGRVENVDFSRTGVTLLAGSIVGASGVRGGVTGSSFTSSFCRFGEFV